MKKIFKRFKKMLHFRREKPYKRILMILMPVLIGVLLILATQYRESLQRSIAWCEDKVSSASLFKRGQSSYLKYDKAVFARVTEEEGVIFLDEPIYERGEPVHFALMKVGKFKKDEDGKNWVDIDILVIDPDGNVAMKKEKLLGNGGHLELEDDTAPSPSGVYVPSSNVKLGKYKVTLRVYDRIGGGEVTDSGRFELIKPKMPVTDETSDDISENPETENKEDAQQWGNTPALD